MSSRDDPSVPRTGAIAVVATLVVAALVTGIVLSREVEAPKAKGKVPPVDLRRSVSAAAERTGSQEPNVVTDEAYFSLYADCPRVLNPDDPKHAGCVARWLNLYAYALDLVGPSLEELPEDKETMVLGLVENLEEDDLEPLSRILGEGLLESLLDAPGKARAQVEAIAKAVASKLRSAKAKDALEAKEALGDDTWEALQWFASAKGQDGEWHPPKVRA